MVERRRNDHVLRELGRRNGGHRGVDPAADADLSAKIGQHDAQSERVALRRDF